MIRCKNFSKTGEYIGTVELDISKPKVAAAIQSALQKGEGSIVLSDLEKLDGQGLSLTKLLALGFSPEEIRAATRRRLQMIDRDLTDVERIEKELDDMLGPGFQGAQGGEATRAGFPGQRPSEQQLREDWNRGLRYDTKSQEAADIVKGAEAAWKKSGRP